MSETQGGAPGFEPGGAGADGARDRIRGEILRRHARLSTRGRPVFCSPTRAEQAVATIPRQRSGTDGKVIYPTRAAAESAARELEGVGARTLRAYACVRGEHFHLATELSGVPLHERIPQQRRPVAV